MSENRALLVVDVQNDFCEGGSLGVAGGGAVARGITGFLRGHRARYAVVVASRDWHDPEGGNGGHFGDPPDFAESWPPHCVAGTPGAEYHPGFDASLADVHVRKGQGRPAYSLFEGVADDGETVPGLLDRHGITAVDVCGIATDYCVLQSALSALDAGLSVTVLADLVAGVAPESTRAALERMTGRGATVLTTAELVADAQ